MEDLTVKTELECRDEIFVYAGTGLFGLTGL